MLLGLHTYSLYLHGIGQAWAGFKLPWERQLSTFQLFDLGTELGLDGFHLDDGVLENLETSFLREVHMAAKERSLYLEYNMSLDLGHFGIGIQHDLHDEQYRTQQCRSCMKFSNNYSTPNSGSISQILSLVSASCLSCNSSAMRFISLSILTLTVC